MVGIRIIKKWGGSFRKWAGYTLKMEVNYGTRIKDYASWFMHRICNNI